MSEKFVARELCEERTKRIEAKIDSTKTDILLAIKNNNHVSWKLKGSIIGSFVLAGSSIIVAYITTFA